MSPKKMVTLVVGIVIFIVALVLMDRLVETVEKGTYQVKQAAVSGKMSAKMIPGLWPQLFGDIETFPTAETFFFTADKDEGKDIDQSIEVRFVDGSVCWISGTCRIMMPRTEQQAIDLVVKHGYKTYPDVEQKLILPTIRNVLRLTANLMTAEESYSAKRSDFITFAADQVKNGLYVTMDETRKVLDPISGEEVTRTFKIIKRDGSNPVYSLNPLDGTGIDLMNFEIKKFVYAEKVKNQIAKQQEARMAVATAKAKAQEAEQAKLTLIAEGKAAVAKAEYEKQEEKIRAVVDAQKDKETAVIKAEKEKDVARLAKEAAVFTKQKEILLGQGEAERKKLVMAADGALKQKLEALTQIHQFYADAYAKRNVPSIFMSGGEEGGNTDDQFAKFMNMMNVKLASDLSLSLSVKGKTDN